MKNIIALLLAAAMLFALCACGGNNTSSTGDNNKKLKVGFIYLHDENSTYDLNFINAAKAACEELGVE